MHPTQIKPRGAKLFAAAGLVVAGLGALAATPAFAQQHAAPAAERTPVVRQVTLLVEDLDRAVDFYQRLGLTKALDKSSDDGEVSALGATDLPLASDPKTTHAVVLKSAGEQGTAIGLVSYDHPRLSSARGNLAGLGAGDMVITIDVPDIQDTYRRLSQIGTRFQRTPYRFTLTTADGNRQTIQRMLAFDPDGHLAEIIQTGAGMGLAR